MSKGNERVLAKSPVKKRRMERWKPWQGPYTPSEARLHGSPVPLSYERVWWNDRFIVCLALTRWDAVFGETLHVLFQTASDSTDVEFYDFMRIKNELFGEDRYALQVFPAQDELVDRSNTYHFHVLSVEMSKQFKEDKLLAIR